MEFILNNLMEQYKKAKGFNNLVLNLDDFYNWLEQYKKNAVNYASMLYSMNLIFIESNTAEVNKSINDSIVLPYNTTIISPYIDDSYKDNNVIKTKFEIQRGIPNYNNFRNDIIRYMTHNPYSSFNDIELMNWKYMHEYTGYEIVLGMFGSIYDDDREDKIKLLEFIKKSTTTPMISQYDVLNDNYFYAIASSPKKRIK